MCQIDVSVALASPSTLCPDYISFAAHTDYQGTSHFIKEVKPAHIVCLALIDMVEMSFSLLAAGAGAWGGQRDGTSESCCIEGV